MFCEFCGSGDECSVCGRGYGEAKSPPRNARFWVYENGGWVKLTIRPECSLEHFKGGPCEEGYHCESTRWRHEGERVVRESASWGRDCDGAYETFGDATCELDKLSAAEALDYETGLTVRRPEWEPVGSGQRDYAAEAMGY